MLSLLCLDWTPIGCREQPQIIEYIKLKAQVAELQKEAADWQRKIQVAQTAAARGKSASGGGSSAGAARSPSGAGSSRVRTAAVSTSAGRG